MERKRARPSTIESSSPKRQAVRGAVLPPGSGPGTAGYEALQRLLGDTVTVERFFAEYWEKKPLIIHRKEAGFYGDLFSRETALRILRESNADAPTSASGSGGAAAEDSASSSRVAADSSRGAGGKRLFLHGRDLRVCKYFADAGHRTEAFGEDEVVSADMIGRCFESGATVQFFQPQRFVDELWRLNGALESFFGNLVGASAYLTPPGSQGLAPHHDDVEVFILQTEGAKHWRLYDPVHHDLPSDYSRDLPRESIGAPIVDAMLEQGDLLYMPRGVVHEADTPEATFSTHVTLSTYQHHSWASFLEAVFPAALERAFHSHRAFREGIPIRSAAYVGSLAASEPTPEQRGAATLRQAFLKRAKRLVAIVAKQLDEEDVDLAMDRVATDFVAHRLPPPPPPAVAAPAAAEDGDDAAGESRDGSHPAETPALRFRWTHPEHVRVNLGGDGLEVQHSLANDRATHLGAPADDEDCSDSDDGEESESEGSAPPDGEVAARGADGRAEEVEGDEAEDEGGDEGDEESGPDAMEGISLPGRLLPLFSLLFEAHAEGGRFVSFDQAVAACSSATPIEVRSAVAMLRDDGLVQVAPDAAE